MATAEKLHLVLGQEATIVTARFRPNQDVVPGSQLAIPDAVLTATNVRVIEEPPIGKEDPRRGFNVEVLGSTNRKLQTGHIFPVSRNTSNFLGEEGDPVYDDLKRAGTKVTVQNGVGQGRVVNFKPI